VPLNPGDTATAQPSPFTEWAANWKFTAPKLPEEVPGFTYQREFGDQRPFDRELVTAAAKRKAQQERDEKTVSKGEAAGAGLLGSFLAATTRDPSAPADAATGAADAATTAVEENPGGVAVAASDKALGGKDEMAGVLFNTAKEIYAADSAEDAAERAETADVSSEGVSDVGSKGVGFLNYVASKAANDTNPQGQSGGKEDSGPNKPPGTTPPDGRRKPPTSSDGDGQSTPDRPPTRRTDSGGALGGMGTIALAGGTVLAGLAAAIYFGVL
jgi:hypothetical protein